MANVLDKDKQVAVIGALAARGKSQPHETPAVEALLAAHRR